MKKYIKYAVLPLLLTFLFLSSSKTYTPTPKTVKIDPEVETKDIVDELRKQYGNGDIIGTIEIEGTNINEAIAQASDNRYYLTHDLYKNDDIYGSVFLDHRCNKDSKKLLIFGHNDFKDKTPFSNLENYMDFDYFKNNQFINLLIDDKQMNYQIFSVYVETSDFTYMNIKIDEEKYNQDLSKYKEKSFYDTGVDVNPGDRILILQTCSNHKDYKNYEDKYLLIIAKLVS